MIKNRIIVGIMATSIISSGVLAACGNAGATDNGNENAAATESTAMTATATTSESVAGADADTNDGTAFGLQDYEGFYCMTMTEAIEDYEVTYTYGYLLNGDGTGVCYGQDVVDITWNETEIHFTDSTTPYSMEPGRLTVGDVTYDKIEGQFITPNPYYVDTDNIEDGIYRAGIDESGISETDDGLTIQAEIYTEDTYDIVDINCMVEGDVIYINGQLYLVNAIDKLDSGIIDINGGLENGGSSLISEEESNCFVFSGMDMVRSYTRQGVANLAAGDSVQVTDKCDPAGDKVYNGNESFSALKAMVEEYPLDCYDCVIRVENGEIVEITRLFTP